MSEDRIPRQDDAIEPAEKTVEQKRSLPPHNRFLIASVLAITFIAFAGTIGYKFVYDDKAQIVENPLIKSWGHAPGYLTNHVWTQEFPGLPGNYYRPAFLFWMLINYMLFGLNASWWHLTSILVHVCVTFMVYLLARRLLKEQWVACMTALIFGLHPVHVEAVAWVSGVTEPLLALFLIPAFLCYLNWREGAPSTTAATVEPGDGVKAGQPGSAKRKRLLWLAASLALYAVAVLEKETALALPALIFIYEWVCLTHEPRAASFAGRVGNAIKVTSPYLALSVIYLIARAIILKGLGHTITPLPILTMVLTWPSVLWTYTKMLTWPVGLSAFYNTPYVTTPGVVNFALPLVAILAAAVFLRMWSRRVRAVVFASALLVVPLLPVLNLSMFYVGENAHDRYLYLPSIGFSILVALALNRIRPGRATLAGRPAFQVLAAIALTAMLGLATSLQSTHWASNLLLFYRGVSIAPDNPIAKNNLANEMVERELYDEAIALYRQVLDHDPNYWRASYNLGFVYYKLGRYEEAEPYLVRSVALNRLDSDEFARLALTRMRLGRLDDAADMLRHAIGMHPEAAGYNYALGIVLRQKGDAEGAINAFKAELVNNPDQKAARGQITELTSESELGK